ncbi:MAG TPA: hypothetical protein VGG33_04195 [Polyangia bacterium]
MLRTRFGVSLLSGPVFVGVGSAVIALSPLVSTNAFGQGQELPAIKVNLPASPNFDAATAPVQHPTGEYSVYGLRKSMTKILDKDVKVKGYLLYLYECPPEVRKCNEEQDAKKKREARKTRANARPDAPPPTAAAQPGGCKACEQPHFFLSDTPNGKMERAILVADYPIKDWKTGKPKPLVVKQGDPYVVTGTFAINSITGFAASNGLIVHKRTEDAAGKVVAEGNAVLPPEAQTIQLEGRPAEPLMQAKQK